LRAAAAATPLFFHTAATPRRQMPRRRVMPMSLPPLIDTPRAITLPRHAAMMLIAA